MVRLLLLAPVWLLMATLVDATDADELPDIRARTISLAGDFVSRANPEHGQRFAAQNFWSGTIPLWNPYQYAGTSFIGDNQSGIFYPFNLFKQFSRKFGNARQDFFMIYITVFYSVRFIVYIFYSKIFLYQLKYIFIVKRFC